MQLSPDGSSGVTIGVTALIIFILALVFLMVAWSLRTNKSKPQQLLPAPSRMDEEIDAVEEILGQINNTDDTLVYVKSEQAF